MSNSIKCPKCQSEQISGGAQGFGAKKAIFGAVIAGPIGLAAGAINKNKATNSCMACGHQWNPADVLEAQKRLEKLEAPDHTLGYPNSEWIVAGVIFVLFLIWILVRK